MISIKMHKAFVRDAAAGLWRIVSRAPAAILLYHTIGAGPESLRQDEFRRQMQWLRDRGYSVVRLGDMVNALLEQRTIARRTVILTFDDGYADNYTEAFPVLREFGFPATVFLATNLIGTEKVNKRGIRHAMLSWGQIRAMCRDGLVEFQPHTERHIRLSYLSDTDAEREMKRSKDTIESMLGGRCRFFAYPFGNYTPRDIALARKYFDAAVTIAPGFIGIKSNPSLLPRNSINHNTTMARFRLRI